MNCPVDKFLTYVVVLEWIFLWSPDIRTQLGGWLADRTRLAGIAQLVGLCDPVGWMVGPRWLAGSSCLAGGTHMAGWWDPSGWQDIAGWLVGHIWLAGGTQLAGRSQQTDKTQLAGWWENTRTLGERNDGLMKITSSSELHICYIVMTYDKIYIFLMKRSSQSAP